MKKIIDFMIDFVKKYQYIIYFLLSIGIIDISARFQYRSMLYFRFLSIPPTLFTIGFAFFILLLFIVLPKKINRIFYIVFLMIFVTLLIVHNVFMEHFGFYFQFDFLSQTGEGLAYLGDYIKTINITTILTIITVIVFAGLTLKTYNREANKKTTIKLVILCSFVSLIAFASGFISLKIEKHEVFFSKRGMSAFTDFNNPTMRFSISGIYVYTMMDIYHQFKVEKIDNQDLYKKVDKYYENNEIKLEKNEYSDIFKDKNLIFVLLENIDSWMLSEKTTPTFYKMMNEGINFTNYWAPTYAVGNTFVSEFVANTGFIPQIGNSQPAYEYSNNYLPYTLPKLFSNQNYIVNSYHVNYSHFYNRGKNHMNWGYTKYYNYKDLGIKENLITQDRYISKNGYEKIVSDSKFMSFILTYSGHMPFDLKKPEVKAHLNFIKKNTDATDSIELAALSQARETDMFFKSLIDSLEKDKKSKDTVIIAFTDHYSYSSTYKEFIKKQKSVKSDDVNFLMNVPFFIWNSELKNTKYTSPMSTIDIVPTISNLFGLDYDPKYYIGTDAFSKNIDKFVFFRDSSWYDGKTYYKDNKIQFGTASKEYINTMNKKVKDKIEYSENVLKSDYFRSNIK